MVSCAGHTTGRPRAPRASRRYRQAHASNHVRVCLYKEQAQHLSAALRCGRALAASWPSPAFRRPGQRQRPRKVSRRPKASAPWQSDDGDSGWLTASEFLMLAFSAGFRGDDVSWMEIFERVCRDHGCDPAKGVSKAAFMKLISETFASRSIQISEPVQDSKSPSTRQLGSTSPMAVTSVVVAPCSGRVMTPPKRAAAPSMESVRHTGSQSTVASAYEGKAMRPGHSARALPRNEWPSDREASSQRGCPLAAQGDASEDNAAKLRMRDAPATQASRRRATRSPGQAMVSNSDERGLSRSRDLMDGHPDDTTEKRASIVPPDRSTNAAGVSCSALRTRSSSLSATVAAAPREGGRQQPVSMRFDSLPASFPSWPFK